MKELKKKSKLETWEMKVECTGSEGDNPCGRYFKVNSKDIVKRRACVMYSCELDIYGFVCPECHSFTEIHIDSIPEVVRNVSQYEKHEVSTKNKRWWSFFKF